MTDQEENHPDPSKNKSSEKEELISRFIFSSKHCSGGKVHYAAFLPPKDRFDISIYRIQNLSEDEIWEIDDRYVSGLRGKKSHGRADLSIRVVLGLNLSIDPNGIPHPRHANVCFSEGMMKDNLKLIAMKLAEASTFVPRKESCGSSSEPSMEKSQMAECSSTKDSI